MHLKAKGVCTYFGGACESEFCHCCVVACSLVYKVSMINAFRLLVVSLIVVVACANPRGGGGRTTK